MILSKVLGPWLVSMARSPRSRPKAASKVSFAAAAPKIQRDLVTVWERIISTDLHAKAASLVSTLVKYSVQAEILAAM